MRILALLLGSLVVSAPADMPTRRTQNEPKIRFRAVDSKGVPQAGVEVYAVGSYLEGLTVVEVGKTNSKGITVSDDAEGDFVALAPDGSVATAHNSHHLLFAKTGYLTLQVVDDHGKPLSGIQTTLIPADDAADLKPYGSDAHLKSLPRPYKDALSKTTDSGGFARFNKLPIGRRFGVIVHAGVEEMQFVGSVSVGKQAHLVLATDREVSGHVYMGAGAKPIEGADVQIYVSAFSGNGAPDQLWRSTKTDSAGAYKLDNLPNCGLLVSVDGKTPGIVFSSTNGGAWIDHGVEGRISAEGYTFEFGTSDIPGNLKTAIDFRIETPAMVHIKLRNPHRRKLSECSLGISQVVNGRMTEGGSGRQCDVSVFRVAAGYGRYAIFIESLSSGQPKILKTLDIKDSKPIYLTVNVP